jgi:isopentenyl-diphosphate delta-isomerase
MNTNNQIKEELLILVDVDDKPMGKLEKLEVHRRGLLHRAFSIFVFNSDKELLLQQRADTKYHSPGLWTNTCCGHPQFGEELTDAVERRLYEEMSLKFTPQYAFSFIYKATVENGLTEYEYDHVFMGTLNTLPQPASSEVKNWKYMDLKSLERDIAIHPEQYTKWLKICLKKVIDSFDGNIDKN